MPRPQIHVLLDDPEMPPAIATALQRVDAGVRLSRLENELRSPSRNTADARLVVTSQQRSDADGQWAALLEHFHRHPCATLVLTPMPVRADAAAPGDQGPPVGFASDLSAEELAGRLTAMCGFHRTYSRLQREIAELRRRDRLEGTDEINQQLRLASQIQRDLLPHPLPRIGGATVHALFRPADHVSGDIYDAVRLDEQHVALSCADATGHGLPAALLTMLIKRALQGKQIRDHSYWLVPPDEVLEQISRELLDANLSQCLFATGVYAVYHEPTRKLCWARGGAPFPILVRSGGPPRPIRSEGPLLGAVDEAKFERVEMTLQPGDLVVFHTDGLDALLTNRRGQRVHDTICQTAWYQRLGTVPVAGQLNEIARLLRETPAGDWPIDDLTVLALEIVQE